MINSFYSKLVSYFSQTLYLPLILPTIGFLFGVVWGLRSFGIALNLFTVITAHLLMILPYLYFSLQGSYQQYDQRYSYVGLTLGKSPMYVFFRIKLRILLAPMIFSSALGILISFNQYLPTLLMGAGSVPTLTTEAIIAAQSGSRRLMATHALFQSLIGVFVLVGAYYCYHKAANQSKRSKQNT